MPSRSVPLLDEQGQFTNLDVTFNQDYMCWITQGDIARRHLEKLGESDRGIILFRKMLLEQVNLVQAGQEPTMNIFRHPAENDGLDFPVIPNEAGAWVGAPRSDNFTYHPQEAGYSRDADKIHWVNDAEYGVFLSYAQPAGRWQVGGNLKLIRQSVGEFSSFGMGLDLGFLRRDLLPNFDAGLTLHDLTGTYLSWSTGRKESIPLVPRLGWAWRHPSETLRGVLLLTGDVDMHFDDRRMADQLWAGSLSANLHWGLEFTMQNRLALRLGLSESEFQAGAGLVAGPVRFDYGIVPDAQELDVSQRLALRYVHSR